MQAAANITKSINKTARGQRANTQAPRARLIEKRFAHEETVVCSGATTSTFRMVDPRKQPRRQRLIP